MTVYLFIKVPKGFIPSGDSGLLLASTEAAQGISFEDMVKHQNVIADIIQHDPNVEAMSSTVGAGGRNAGGNTGTIFIVLKPPNQRKLSADQVVEELRPKLSREPGIRAFIQNLLQSILADAPLAASTRLRCKAPTAQIFTIAYNCSKKICGRYSRSRMSTATFK